MARSIKAVDRARALRKQQTPIEAQLWSKLRAGQLRGFRFRRKHPLGPFFADFCCEEARLVVEIDADSHVEQQEYDETRTAYLVMLTGMGC